MGKLLGNFLVNVPPVPSNLEVCSKWRNRSSHTEDMRRERSQCAICSKLDVLLFHEKEVAEKRNHYFSCSKIKKLVGKVDNVPPTPGKEEASVAHSSSREIFHWAG